ncbi:MAG: ABC transporter ATP-binding protein [Candidatus Eremiobacteraeota bacterium]|nr:ABC transporter ATP-binding protein [Candidatus Eremiobacteraeota bacterium]
MGKLAIETHGLSKIYRSGKKKLSALKELDLHVEEGHVFGFIGPNGAGKTTTIKVLMGLISPTSGEASIFEEPIATVASKEKIGYLSEIAYYYSFMEAENLLHFYGALRGIGREKRRQRIKEYLELVGLAQRGRTRLREYSKGMLQRFGIALALIGDPPLLILDEPTSGLDPIGRKEVKDVIMRLKARGITIFLSSHHLSEVERICDMIGIIHRGTMLQCAPLSHFLEQGRKVYTIRYTGGEPAFEEALASRKITVEKTENHTKKMVVEEKDVPELLKLLLERGGQLVEVIPGPGSLEEIFFDIITKGGKEE